LLNKNINFVINFVLKAISFAKKVYNIFCQKKEIIRVYLNNIKTKIKFAIAFYNILFLFL